MELIFAQKSFEIQKKDFHPSWDWKQTENGVKRWNCRFSKWNHSRFMSRGAWLKMIWPTDIAQFCILNYFHSKGSKLRLSQRVKVTICRHLSVLSGFLFISTTMEKLVTFNFLGRTDIKFNYKLLGSLRSLVLCFLAFQSESNFNLRIRSEKQQNRKSFHRLLCKKFTKRIATQTNLCWIFHPRPRRAPVQTELQNSSP